MTAPALSFSDLLEALSYEDGESISINYAEPGGQFHSLMTTPAQVQEVIDRVKDTANVWWGINAMHPGVEGRGKVADVTRWTCLHADLDVKPGGMPSFDAAGAVVTELSSMIGSRPVAIVYTGNGFQPYWALDPADDGTELRGEDQRNRAVALLRRWGRLVQRVAAANGGRVDSVYDLPRVLRVPGTFNRKSEPKPVVGMADQGSPVTVDALAECLDAYAVPAYDSDSEILGGRLTDPAGWEWGTETCHYTRAMIESWASEEVTARHPWLISCATRLAAARRRGCIAREDYAAAWAALVARMEVLCATVTPVRPFDIGELRDAEAWGTDRVATMPDERVSAELGDHSHHDETIIVGGDQPSNPASEDGPRTGPDLLAQANPADVLTNEQQSLADSDDGMALVLFHRYGDVIRYCVDRGRWLVWNGQLWEWQPEGGGMVRELYKRIARGLPATDKQLYKRKQHALRASTTSDVIRMAQTDSRVLVKYTELDARPNEINTPGGIVLLQTGELIPHDPACLHTRTTLVTPEAPVVVTLWDQFIDQVFGGNRETIAYVQQLVGVSILGTSDPQVLPFCIGEGGNGKGVFLESIIKVAKDYATSAPEGFLLAGPSRHLTEIADLYGRRMVVASEVNEGDRFDEAKMKRLTGGDTLKANFMRKDLFEFEPTHKLWLVANHRPKVTNTTDNKSVWRRVKPIPFNFTVPEDQVIDNLKTRLVTEAGPAILHWIVQGAVSYFAAGSKLIDPPEVVEATQEYQAEQDTVQQFLDDMVHVGGGSTGATALYEAYRSYCRKMLNEDPISQKKFGDTMSRKGFNREHNRTGWHYLNMFLLDTSEESESDDGIRIIPESPEQTRFM